MSEIIKNAVLAGIGLISLTREKAEEFAKELIKKGELSENEKAKFVKDVLEQSEKSKREIEEKIEKTVETVMAKMNIPSKKEFEELKKKVEELSQLLNKKTE
ncbi:MAG TPA: phasin family protein [Paludibacteraceae bacterium]|nr:phasin family protein [Paludibacteraceae bacterium]HOL00560.1 phasin family protein [Paludibacteraceae bacterium]